MHGQLIMTTAYDDSGNYYRGQFVRMNRAVASQKSMLLEQVTDILFCVALYRDLIGLYDFQQGNPYEFIVGYFI